VKKLSDVVIQKRVKVMQTDTRGVAHQVTREIKKKLVVKTTGQGLRIVHLLVDYYGLIFLLSFLSTSLFGSTGASIILLFPVINILLETFFQQTLGKMLTGSIVINEYAEKPNFVKCILRAVIRIVPFEPFSNLNSPSRGWHDRWSETYVIKKTDLEKLQNFVNPDLSLVEEFGEAFSE
jgi:uncharacterized RDD family membrane protein YckC